MDWLKTFPHLNDDLLRNLKKSIDEGFRIGVDTITSTTFRLRIINTDGSANIGYNGVVTFFCGE